MKSLKCFVARSTAILLLCAAGTGAAYADFSGYYTLDNWTLEMTLGTNGFVDPSTGDATTIMLTSSFNETGGFTDFFITVPADGTVSFDWFFDIPATEVPFEFAGYLLNGTSVQFGTVPSVVFAPLMVPVLAGDVFGFYVESFDGLFEPGILTITNFSAPVPVPAALWLFGSALLGLGALRRRFSTRS